MANIETNYDGGIRPATPSPHELSANDSTESYTSESEEDAPESCFARSAADWWKQHGVWCRVKSFSLARSCVGTGPEPRNKAAHQGHSKLRSLRRRLGYKSNERACHYMRVQRELRKEAKVLEKQLVDLTETNQRLDEDRRTREQHVTDLQNKLRAAGRSLHSTNQELAKQKGLLELSKLQSRAQQQVLDSKQDDVIKMATRQAELCDEIRKLKLTIETLRNKLEMQDASTEPSHEDETAEHASNLRSASATTVTMEDAKGRQQVAESDRPPSGRDTELNDQPKVEEVRGSGSARKGKRAGRGRVARTNRRWERMIRLRIKHQRARNVALREEVKIKTKKIEDLVNERKRLRKYIKGVRFIAEVSVELFTPVPTSTTTTPTTPCPRQGTPTAVDVERTIRRRLLHEMRRIVSKLKDLEAFLGGDQSFDEFMQNQEQRERTTAEEKISTRAAAQLGMDSAAMYRLTKKIRGWKHNGQHQPRGRVGRKLSKRAPSDDTRAGARVKRSEESGRSSGTERCGQPYDVMPTHAMVDAVSQSLKDKMNGHSVVKSSGSCEEEVSAQSLVNEEAVLEKSTKDVGGTTEVHCQDNAGAQDAHSDSHSVIGGNTADIELPGDEGVASGREPSNHEASEPAPDTDPSSCTCGDVQRLSAESKEAVPAPEDRGGVQCNSAGPVVQGLSRNEFTPDLQRSLYIQSVSFLLVDKWSLEGQIKALADNEQGKVKTPISSPDDVNVVVLQETVERLGGQVKKMEEDRREEEAGKQKMETELGEWKERVGKLEVANKRLENEVQGWMETVMELRKGRIALLDHIKTLQGIGKKNVTAAVPGPCECSKHSKLRVDELTSDIEALSEQRKIQDSHIERLSKMVEQASREKRSLISQLEVAQRERSDLQTDFDLLINY